MSKHRKKTPPVKTTVMLAVSMSLIAGAVSFSQADEATTRSTPLAVEQAAPEQARQVFTRTVVAPPPQVEPAPAPIDVTDLPWSRVFDFVPARQDPGTKFTGRLAAAKHPGVPVHRTPDGKPIAKLPVTQLESDPGWLPIIDVQDGWLQVLLPSRINLPSEGGPVNKGTGWVAGGDMETKASTVIVTADLSADTVTVTKAGKVIAEYAIIQDGGKDTVRGRTFAVSRYKTDLSRKCSSEPMLVLAAQTEEADGYLGQDTGLNAIHGFSQTCFDLSGYTEATPGCIILSDADMRRLLKNVPDGTPVTVND